MSPQSQEATPDGGPVSRRLAVSLLSERDRRRLDALAVEYGITPNKLAGILINKALDREEDGADSSDRNRRPAPDQTVETQKPTSLAIAEEAINAASGGGWNGRVLLSQLGITDGSPETVSNHLGSAGMRARKTGDHARAKLLWGASLAVEPTNLRTSSAYGQALYFEKNFREALEYLERAEGHDNYALLYAGWANLELGLENDDDQQLDEGIDRIKRALSRWAADAKNPTTRRSWIEQAKRLKQRVELLPDEVEEIAMFTRDTVWTPVTTEELG